MGSRIGMQLGSPSRSASCSKSFLPRTSKALNELIRSTLSHTTSLCESVINVTVAVAGCLSCTWSCRQSRNTTKTSRFTSKLAGSSRQSLELSKASVCSPNVSLRDKSFSASLPNRHRPSVRLFLLLPYHQSLRNDFPLASLHPGDVFQLRSWAHQPAYFADAPRREHTRWKSPRGTWPRQTTNRWRHHLLRGSVLLRCHRLSGSPFIPQNRATSDTRNDNPIYCLMSNSTGSPSSLNSFLFQTRKDNVVYQFSLQRHWPWRRTVFAPVAEKPHPCCK